MCSTKESTVTPPVKRRILKPWLFGILAGIAFVVLEAVFNAYPPSAYGFCLSCHTRDLISRAANALFGTSWAYAPVSGRALMLTSPAVLAGAFFAAKVFKEGRVKRAERPLRSLLYGFSIMTIGIIIFGCPTRLLLRAGYGDIYAVFGVIALYAGVTAATFLLRRRFGA